MGVDQSALRREEAEWERRERKCEEEYIRRWEEKENERKKREEEERKKKEEEDKRKEEERRKQQQEYADKMKPIYEQRRAEKIRQYKERKRQREEEERHREEIERLKESGVLGWKFVMYFHNCDYKDAEHILHDISKFCCEKHDTFIFETKDRRIYTFYSDYNTMIFFLEHFIEKTYYDSVYKEWSRDVFRYEILELHPTQLTNKIIFYPYNKGKYYLANENEWIVYRDYYNNYIEVSDPKTIEAEIDCLNNTMPYIDIINDENYLEVLDYIVSNGKDDEYGNLEEQLKKYNLSRCDEEKIV